MCASGGNIGGRFARRTQAHRVNAAACSLVVALGGTMLLASAAVQAHDAHLHQHYAAPAPTRTTANYVVPEVMLQRDDGRRVSLTRELDDGRPVVLSFVYTSCTTVCPLTSQTLAQLQDKLGAARELVHMVSISIDPEYDTPSRLHDYAARFGAGPQWQHYTGTPAAVQATQRAFSVNRGNKMDHEPVTLVRGVPGAPWVRLDGFATADQLMAELTDVCLTK
jgi:protein SCO1/2